MKKLNIGEVIFQSSVIAILAIFSISVIYPFLRQLTVSLSPPELLYEPSLSIFPSQITFESYKKILSTGQLTTAYMWTAIRCILSCSLTLIIASSFGYSLSKKQLPFRDFFTTLLVITMFVSGGIIPDYLLMRDLNLINTIWALVLPGIILPFNLLIMRNYFMSLPEELEESAAIDGATEFTMFFRIILPLSKPILATVALWSIVGNWNAWFDALIYINNNKIIVLQVILRRVLLENDPSLAGFMSGTTVSSEAIVTRAFTPESVKAAILMIATIPILAIYPFVQKYFVKGIMMGALKG